jgi:hypothetical protein
MGVVSGPNGNPLDATAFTIGCGRVFKPTISGELMVFANDWRSEKKERSDDPAYEGKDPYDNNLGCLVLTIRKLP